MALLQRIRRFKILSNSLIPRRNNNIFRITHRVIIIVLRMSITYIVNYLRVLYSYNINIYI